MFKKIAYNFFIVLGLATAQLAVVGGLPDFLGGLNLITAAMVFVLGLKGFENAAYIVLGAGLVEDIYSFSVFGLHLSVLFLTLIAVSFLYESFFTNRSLYSFAALAAIADFIYIMAEKGAGYFLNRFSGSPLPSFGADFASGALNALILNAVFAGAVFYAMNFLSRKFKPVFLTRKN